MIVVNLIFRFGGLIVFMCGVESLDIKWQTKALLIFGLIHGVAASMA